MYIHYTLPNSLYLSSCLTNNGGLLIIRRMSGIFFLFINFFFFNANVVIITSKYAIHTVIIDFSIRCDDNIIWRVVAVHWGFEFPTFRQECVYIFTLIKTLITINGFPTHLSRRRLVSGRKWISLPLPEQLLLRGYYCSTGVGIIVGPPL